MIEQEVFQVRPVAPGIHVITELGYSHSYLIQGKDWALLVDTGLGTGDIKMVVEKITSSPIVVVNTHAHWEHIGGNHLFDIVAIHPHEAEKLEQGISAEDMIPYLQEVPDNTEFATQWPIPGMFHTHPSQASFFLNHGDPIDLGGGRVLEVLHTPGHTPGSICLLDEASRLLFTGDTIHLGQLGAHLAESNLSKYAETANSLYSIGWDINLVLPGHGDAPLDGGILLEMGSGFERLMEGEGMYEEVHEGDQAFFDVTLGRFSVRTLTSLRRL